LFVRDQAGVALRQKPVIAALRATNGLSANRFAEGMVLHAAFELDLTLANLSGERVGARIFTDKEHWTEIGFDGVKHEFYMDRSRSGAPVSPGFLLQTAAPSVSRRPLAVTIVVDRCSVEAFAQDGTIAMANLVFPAGDAERVAIFPGTRVLLKGIGWEFAIGLELGLWGIE
jgi:fructan beta-fructosidase